MKPVEPLRDLLSDRSTKRLSARPLRPTASSPTSNQGGPVTERMPLRMPKSQPHIKHSPPGSFRHLNPTPSRQQSANRPRQTLEPVAPPSIARRPDWLIKPDLLSPLNSIASRPDALIAEPNKNLQIIALLWHPKLDDEVLTIAQLKQLSARQFTGINGETTNSHTNSISQASYQEQDAGSINPQDKAAQQDDPPPSAPTLESQEEVDSLRKQIASRKTQINANEALEEGVKNDANNQLNTATEWLTKAAAAQAYLKKESAAKDDKKSGEANAVPQEELVAESPKQDATLDDLKEILQSKETNLELLLDEQQDLQTRIANRSERVLNLPALRKQAENAVKDTIQLIEANEKQPDDFSKPLSRLVLQSKKVALELEVKKLTTEALRLEQIGRSLPVERDRLTQKIQNRKTEVKRWREATDKRLKAEIEQQRQDAIEAALKAAPELKIIAKQNQAYANMRRDLIVRIDTLQADLDRLKSVNSTLEKEQSTLEQRIETTGLTSSNGILLVAHRRTLPSTAHSQESILQLIDELRVSKAKTLELESERVKLVSTLNALETAAEDEAKAKSDPEDPPLSVEDKIERAREREKTELFETKKRALLNSQLDIISSLLADHRNHQKKNLAVEVEHGSLIRNVNKAKEYVDENALWVRSANRVHGSDLEDSITGLRSFFNRKAWNKLLASIGKHIIDQPYETGLMGLIIGGLFVVQRRLRWSHE